MLETRDFRLAQEPREGLTRPFCSPLDRENRGVGYSQTRSPTLHVAESLLANYRERVRR